MATKMSPKFVVLSALAVGAIYATGYSISATGSTALAASGAAAGNVAGGSPNQASAGNAASQASGSAKSQSGSSSAAKTNQTASHGAPQSANTSANSSSSKSSGTSSSSSKAAAQQYLDGTYTGSAANRIGAVGVSVTIKSGKIANVQITSCYTHYPESYINPVLPNYVVAHQTTQIPVVSGATLSTEDFYYAVVQALQKAQNPNYKG